ncbi:nitrogenase cofactor biosynthesis protein NifB [Clostridium akagii]|uniref:nitrogenase cofactor biosynthesis protein NifB n=1 Tax=Clostridium akagii TaxID=91623 RepID=UPI00047B7E2B|nr:nitrogenase cofactor biosynthesis protein NifB [Clostridium akagii]
MSNKSYVNLDVNPCKMCMPMGAVLAFKGIEGNMVILHGSQGCSTYIRRHMATHYNEPIDIASSSLTENGTIYGGTKNLKTGLKNMIKMYTPTTIGVMTTCLAETIGEDINRIVGEFYDENTDENLKNIKIITVPTPGYSGTQTEGYYRALRKIVEQVTVKCEKDKKINIICANLNPGDVRNIKSILDCFGVGYTILPDVSNTLDAPHEKGYKRIPDGGTKIKDIESMGGALGTIEMGVTLEDQESPGVYLRDTFGVPLYRCGVPIGIRNTDEFISQISEISGIPVPDSFKTERGRYLDAMIDSHKYNGEVKAILYGEPELVLAVTKICAENGITLKLIALGTKNKILKSSVKHELENQVEDAIIIDDTDFETIEKHAKILDVNLIIGNSDGRRMAARMGVKMVRIGFPIHDRVGAQRQVITGYNGSSFLIDSIANTILEYNEDNFRKKSYDSYFVPEEEEIEIMQNTEELNVENKNIITNEDKTCTHPCYGDNAHQFARMHIPVAPKCNISCNYCVRKYDCLNESRPGVTSEVLTPEQALAKFKEVKSKMKNLTVLGIAGPGDALANFDEVRKSIELIKKEDPNITFCLSTNGLMLPFYANQLVELGVSHITVTINAVDIKIGAKVYKEVNYLGKKYVGEEAAEILMNNQLTGLRYLCSKGIICKVNTVMIKGINDEHIVDVIKKVKECGVYITNIMQMIPVKGSGFENLPMVSNQELKKMRKESEKHVKQMYHCKQCRADAIGTLSQDCSIDFRNIGCNSDYNDIEPKATKTNEDTQKTKILKFAISSKSGINIDQHFGHSNEFHIYSYDGVNVKYLEKRDVDKYCDGAEECDEHDDKIGKILKTIEGCDAVLTLRAGIEPIKKLEKKGIRVIQMYDSINEGIQKAAKEMQG